MTNAAMHDPAQAAKDVEEALSEVVGTLKIDVDNRDYVPARIREEGHASAKILRASAAEVAQRIIDAATAVCTRAQDDLAYAEEQATEIKSRAESAAILLEQRAETDAKVAEQMAITLALILPPIASVTVLNNKDGFTVTTALEEELNARR